MELVYLWVEKYKNIHEQGFNFSPRFTCDYDGKKLTIKENHDYIENFFGDNINVTAIVGKNGSGKSSVLKCLKKYINTTYSKTEEKILIMFYSKENKTFQYQSSFLFTHNKDLKKEQYLKNTSFSLFDYSFSQYKIQDNRVFPQKYTENFNGISFNKETTRNIGNIIQNYKYLKKYNLLKEFNDFFIPEKILINIDFIDLKQRYRIKDKNRVDSLEEKFDELEEMLAKGTTIEDFKKVFFTIDEEFEFFFNLSINKILNLKKHQNQYINKTDEKGVYTIFEFDLDGLDYVQKEAYDKCLMEMEEGSLINQEKGDEGEESRKKNIFVKSIGRELLEYMEDSLLILDVIDKNKKSLNHLSFGEQQLFNILNQIFTLGISDNIKKISGERVIDTGSKEIEDGVHDLDLQNFIIFFDEIDIGFHPNWQKKTIQYMLDFLKLILDKQFHLIFTTHSPFLLSDIPKENIIFLGDNPPNNQTFGANIHTLLSDSFFMENGLMGEFAKGKINEIKRFYDVFIKYQKNKKINKAYRWIYLKKRKKFWQIQSIIGEPFLQKVIKNYLDELELLFSDDKTLIDKELADIEKRKVYLESLKNAKN